MDAPHQAALGVGLLGIGHLAAGALFLTLLGPQGFVGGVLFAIVGAALLASTPAFAARAGAREPALLAGALLVAAGANLPLVVVGLAEGLYMPGFLLNFAGLAQAAWLALMLHTRGKSLSDDRGGIRLGFAAMGVGFASWFVLNVVYDQAFLAASIPALAGAVLAVRALPRAPAPAQAAPEAQPAQR